MGGRPASTSSDVMGEVLKAPRIQWVAECQIALMVRRSTSRGVKIEAP